MTDEITPPPPTPSTGSKRRTKLWMAGIALAAVVVIAVLAALLAEPTEDKLVWLTPTEFTKSLKPGPFTTIKYRIKNWTAPLWRRFKSPAPGIMIDCRLLTLSPAVIEQFKLRAPVINADGRNAWVLSPDESSALRGQLKTNPAVTLTGNPRVVTGSGMQASMFTGNYTTVSSTKLPQPTGISIDMVPTFTAGLIKLTVNASASESVESGTNGMSVRTNFAAACQAMVPSGGSVVLDGGPAKGSDGKIYWMVLSPTTVDAKGNAIPKKK